MVECCSHLIKRLRADSKLQVPCDILLAKARAPNAGAFTKNFALVFLEIGCPRLPPQGKSVLGQALLVGLAAEGTSDEGQPYGRQQVALVHRLLEVQNFNLILFKFLTQTSQTILKGSKVDRLIETQTFRITY